MNTYLVGGFFYRIVEAENPTKAWIEYITMDVDIQNKRIWNREEARQELIKRGFKKLQITKTENVYEVFK